jgi:crotonobetainyl-CoA:carnitine CoA-transferase CaiB-like acyl-CoA transferase
VSYGPAQVPLSGLSSLTGYADWPPMHVGISYGDPNGGWNAATAICAALVARERTGRGQYIDVSLWEAMSVLVPEGWMGYAMNGGQPQRMGNRDILMAPHNCYPAAGEDEWVTIACADDAEWRALAQAMGRPELADDPRFAGQTARKANEDALDALIGEWTRAHTKWQTTEALQAMAVAAFPTMHSGDLNEDPHIAGHGFFSQLPHPEVGARKHPGIPWRTARGPNGVRSAAPILGADTDQVLRDVLGYPADRIARLREAQVLN